MGRPDVYKEDIEWALPGACSKKEELSHERIIRSSDPEWLTCCCICRLPFHQIVRNEWRQEREKLGDPPQPPPGPRLATYHNSGSIYHTRRNESQYEQPRINSSPPIPNNVLLAGTDAIATSTLNGHNGAKRTNARLKGMKSSHYNREEATVKLRINTFSCQYYVNGDGDEATLVPTDEIARWVTDVAVPPFEDQSCRTLHDWLIKDVVNKYKYNEREVCLQANCLMEFVSHIRVTQQFNVKVVQLEDYKNMTVRLLFDEEAIPWRLNNAITKCRMYTAYVVVYREQVAPPARKPKAKPLLPPPRPSTPTNGGLVQDKGQNDDPFLDESKPDHFLPGQPMGSKPNETPRALGQYIAASATPTTQATTTPTTQATTTPTRIVIDLTSDSDEDELPDIQTVADRERWFSPSRKLTRQHKNNSPASIKGTQQAAFVKTESPSPNSRTSAMRRQLAANSDHVQSRLNYIEPVATRKQAVVLVKTEKSDAATVDTNISPSVKPTGVFPQEPKSPDTKESLINNPSSPINAAKVPSDTQPTTSCSWSNVSSELSSTSSSTDLVSPVTGSPRKRKSSQSSTPATNLTNGNGPMTRRRTQDIKTTEERIVVGSHSNSQGNQRALRSRVLEKPSNHIYHIR